METTTTPDTSSVTDYSSSSYTDFIITIGCCIAITFQLLRLSIHLIQIASIKEDKKVAQVEQGSKNPSTSSTKGTSTTSYGSIDTKKVETKDKDKEEKEDGDNDETKALLPKTNNDNKTDEEKQESDILQAVSEDATTVTTTNISSRSIDRSKFLPRLSLVVHFVLALLFFVVPIYLAVTSSSASTTLTTTAMLQKIIKEGTGSFAGTICSMNLCFSTTFVLVMGIVIAHLDKKRQRWGFFNAFFYIIASLSLWITFVMVKYYNTVMKNNSFSFAESSQTMILDTVLLIGISIYLGLTFVDCCVASSSPQTGSTSSEQPTSGTATTKRRRSSLTAIKEVPSTQILQLLKPYFWPDATSNSAMLNRFFSIMTWVFVFLSKVCNLVSPIFLGWASTELAHQSYAMCVYYSCVYSVLQFLGSAFKEGQSLVYMRVEQAAFVQISEYTFEHLHSLSLDWHLRKKLGEVIRNMDRGIEACNTLMKYLCLWLIPAIFECVVVCIIFAAYFHYIPLAITVFYFVFLYIVWTILVTLWRKKFRKQVNVSDNEWRDRFTDSLVNFETVKYFTAEQYEAKRFRNSIGKYQAGRVNVQASLSFLNISQKFLMQACLAMGLSLSAYGIQKRGDCCTLSMGCDSVISDCCRDISTQVCPGMEVGDFVAVLTYTLNLFAPLNFLGSVYNAVVLAIVDLQNFWGLLAETCDVNDLPNAIELPNPTGTTSGENGDADATKDDDIAVEFDNVYFHYPTQSPTGGLKGLSFKMKRGTTTAIVGPTGAGKTTLSRLFFRFYDVLGGSIKVNGVDVREVTQKSLRGQIGCVPQSAIMFNDTIRNNIQYGNQDATDEQVTQAAEDAQILQFIDTLEQKWDTVVGDRGLKLSGGEKQRAAIARCLLKDPPFVVLDEATSSLDTLTENSVQEALDRLSGSGDHPRTVLVIAHRLGTIRNADNIIVLKDGTVCEQGTHDELLTKPNGTYAELWNMQLHSTSRSTSRDNLLF